MFAKCQRSGLRGPFLEKTGPWKNQSEYVILADTRPEKLISYISTDQNINSPTSQDLISQLSLLGILHILDNLLLALWRRACIQNPELKYNYVSFWQAWNNFSIMSHIWYFLHNSQPHCHSKTSIHLHEIMSSLPHTDSQLKHLKLITDIVGIDEIWFILCTYQC